MGTPRRKNGAAKPRASAKAKAKSAIQQPKKTAEQLSDQERQRLLLHHRRKLKPLLESEKIAKAAVTKQYELAKKEGVTKKMLTLAILAESEEGRAKLLSDIQQTLDVDRWVGSDVGEQLEMFAKQSSDERHFEDGRIAALDDQPAKPPAHLSQKAEQRWLAGHAAGVKQNNEARLSVFKVPKGSNEAAPIGTVAAGVVEKAGAEAVDSLAA